MAEVIERYVRGSIAMGAGDLVTVTNIKITTKNNGKQVHTLRRKGAGVTLGTEETEVTFDAVTGEFGEEADWFKFVKKGTIKQIRVKVPGKTRTVNGMYTEVGEEIPIDDAIKQSLTFVGHLDD